MKLHNFQHDFKTLMLDHPSALEQPPDPIAMHLHSGSIPLPERLKIYRANIVGGLTDALVATFPAVEKLVGKPFLETLARSFILHSPPRSGCLSSYGEGLDDFLRTYPPARGLPYLADMAQLELAMNHAYHAPDDAPLTADTLASIAPETLSDLHLNLRQSARLIHSPFAIGALHGFCLADTAEATSPPEIDDETFLLIHRPHLETLITPLSSAEYALLNTLQKGDNLGNAAEQALSLDPSIDFSAFLKKHLTLETFAAPSAK